MIANTTLRTALLLSTALAVALAARADSDGYYCAGGSYLAYELRVSQPQLDDQHVLMILRAGPGPSIQERTIVLPDFQVHAMRCGDSTVDLAGWDAVYTADLTSNSLGVSRTPLPRPGDFPAWPNANLAQWNAGSEMVELPWEVPHFVKIAIEATPRHCVRRLTTRLYRSGTTSPLKTLVERDFRIECGE